jgi:hypothetical protein
MSLAYDMYKDAQDDSKKSAKKSISSGDSSSGPVNKKGKTHMKLK